MQKRELGSVLPIIEQRMAELERYIGDEPFVVEANAFWTQWIILDTVANDQKILDMP